MIDPKDGLKLMRAEFAPNQISKMCRSTKKDNPKGKCPRCGGWHGLPAVQLDYVGHAALTDRLLDADPAWTWEPMATGQDGYPVIDGNGGLWIKLTVCGVTRYGYGDAQGKVGGDAMKERIGDALRNAAMRFGAALELWHKGVLHISEDDGEISTAESVGVSDVGHSKPPTPMPAKVKAAAKGQHKPATIDHSTITGDPMEGDLSGVGDDRPCSDETKGLIMNAFAKIGFTLPELEKEYGKPSDQWMESDVPELRAVLKAMQIEQKRIKAEAAELGVDISNAPNEI